MGNEVYLGLLKGYLYSNNVHGTLLEIQPASNSVPHAAELEVVTLQLAD